MAKGQKKCPKCGNYCGVRTRICKCRHDFTYKARKKLEKANNTIAPLESKHVKLKKKLEELLNPEEKDTCVSKVANRCHGRMILYPAGDCPVKLVKFTEDSIREWRTQVIEAGEKIGLFYGPSAIRYFAHQFVRWGSPKSNDVVWILEKIFKEEYDMVEAMCKEKENEI